MNCDADLQWFCSYTPGMVIAIAALIDYGIGDPWSWPHPVQVMGATITSYTSLVLGSSPAPRALPRLALRSLGIILALGLVLGSGLAGYGIVMVSNHIQPWLGLGVDVIITAACFAGRSLRAAAEDVLAALSQSTLEQARSRLSLYVGRDTAALTEPEILRAVLETVSENAVDGVLAPLFYGLVGILLATELAASGLMPVWPVCVLPLAYKAASTLDSMVGYREAPYTDLGYFSARLEDHLTWIPCRLAVLSLCLLSGRPRYVWQTCQRDAPQDPSPNSGWSECVYAAVLGVQLGGVNSYRGVVKQKPLLGDPKHAIRVWDIQEAIRLTRWTFLIWLTLGVGLHIAIVLWQIPG